MSQSVSDQELMTQFKRNGDRGAFTELVHRWDYQVLAYLAKACGNSDDAQDLRQEVFLRLFRYGGTYNPQYSFSTWLFRIATNVLKSWQMRHYRQGAVTEPLDEKSASLELADGGADPRERAAIADMRERLQNAISLLSADERTLILLRLNQNLPYREIAQILGAPETTIKSRFYTLLLRVRQSLNHSNIAEGR